MNPRNVKAMESRYMSQKMMLRGDSCIEHSNDFNRMLEIHKKTKMQNGFCTPHPEDNSREEPRQPNGINGNISASKLLNAHMGQTNSTYQANRPHSQPPMAVTPSFQKQPRSSAMQPITERSQRSTQGHGVNSVTAMVSWNQPPATPNDNSKSAIVSYPSTLVEKKRTGTPNLFSQRSNGDDKMMSQKHKDASEVQQISFTKPEGGARKPKGVASVELLTHRLGKLCIYGRNNKSKNALVPHRGNNAIIPFEPIKKRKPRPKVDLDPETDRLWRLLMGKEGSEDTETLDKDKEKWWEDERRVFRGRADSFIACMHLVKGDRLFSRWKGSVVDSVVGVFLTQNVSDHLSSSAFMSLAAKFALKSTSTNEIPSQDGTRVFVEEPTEAVPPSDTMITHSKIGRQPVFNPSSFASCESYEHTKHHNISSTKSAAYEHNRTSEEVILSQNSLDSCTIQAVDEIRSGSGSNSEAADQTVGFETIKEPSPVKSMQPERVSVFKEFFNHVSGAPPVNDRLQYTHKLLKAPKQIPTTSGVDISMSLRNAGSPVFGLLRGESILSLKSGITDRYDTSYLASRLQVLPQVPQYDFVGNHQNNLLRGSHTGRIYSKDLAHPHDVRYKISDRNMYCREGNHDAVPGCVVARKHLGPKRKRPRHESIDRDDVNSDEQIDKFCEEGASGSGTIREEEDANDPFNGLSDGEKFNQVHREVKDIKRELTGVKKTLEDLVKFLTCKDPTPRK